MTENKSVVELLTEYYKSPVTQKLRDKFLTQSLFDVIQKERSETVHSNFLKWIFDMQNSNGIEGFNIISSLIQAAHKRAQQQGKSFPSELAVSAYGKSTNIRLSKEVEREYQCPGVYCKVDDKKKNFGIVDIVINGNISQKGESKPFKIIIENKVDSSEHDSQTWKYYTFFEGKLDNTPEGIVIENEELLYNRSEDELRIYLFLTPESDPEKAVCGCDHFIKINYQDIMDFCITPLLQSSQLDSRNRVFLEEYSRALSIPYINNIGKTKIMSLKPEDAVLLKEFWEANQTLITLSLEALREDKTLDSDQKTEIETTVNGIQNLQSSRKKYSIKYVKDGKVINNRPTNQSRLMYDLMDMYIENKVKDADGFVSRYKDFGSVFCYDDNTTGYSKDVFTLNDNRKVRVTTQMQRYDDNLKKFKETAQEDGFIIDKN